MKLFSTPEKKKLSDLGSGQSSSCEDLCWIIQGGSPVPGAYRRRIEGFWHDNKIQVDSANAADDENTVSSQQSHCTRWAKQGLRRHCLAKVWSLRSKSSQAVCNPAEDSLAESAQLDHHVDELAVVLEILERQIGIYKETTSTHVDYPPKQSRLSSILQCDCFLSLVTPFIEN